MKNKMEKFLNGFIVVLTIRWVTYLLVLIPGFFTPAVYTKLVEWQNALSKNEGLYKGVDFILNGVLGIPGIGVLVIVMIVGWLFTKSSDTWTKSENQKKGKKVQQKAPSGEIKRYYIRVLTCDENGNLMDENVQNVTGQNQYLEINLSNKQVRYQVEPMKENAELTLINDVSAQKEIYLRAGQEERLFEGKIMLIYCPL